MEKQVFKRSLFLRIIVCFFIVFGIFGIILTFIAKEYKLIYIPIIFLLIFFCLAVVSFVKYVFTKDEIIFKYPLFKEKKYKINDIIGLEFVRINAENWFIIYFENSKIKIEYSGKIFKEKIIEFYEDNKNKIIVKNIDKINNNGFAVTLSKNKLIFFNNRIEIIGKNNKTYYFDRDIKSIKSFEIVRISKIINIVTNDNFKIKLISDKCKGGMGLFEYLMKNVNQTNCA